MNFVVYIDNKIRMYETIVNTCQTVAWGTALIGGVFGVSLAIIEIQKTEGSKLWFVWLRTLAIMSFLLGFVFGVIMYLFGLFFPFTIPIVLFGVYNRVIKIGLSDTYICFKWSG